MPLPYHTQIFTIGDKQVRLLIPDPIAAQDEFRNGILPPYWSQVWPAALGLTRYLASNTQLIQGKKLVELAAGLGLPSIFAAHYAAHVVCSDYLKDATWFIGESARLNGLTNLETRVLNWHHLPPDLEADVVLLSDVNYEPSEFPVLQTLVQQLLLQGTCVILSTPQRLAGREFITPLLASCQQQQVVTIPHGKSLVAVNVFVLKNK